MATRLPQKEVHYLTSDGDVVDRICWDYYGQTEKTTEAVFRRNPTLTNYKAILPAGLLLILPVVTPVEAAANGIRLWEYASGKSTATNPTRAKADPFDRNSLELERLEEYRRERDRNKKDPSNPQNPGTNPGSGTGGSGDDGGGGVDDPDGGGSGGGGSGGGGTTDDCACNGCVDKEPITLGAADWFAVWYRDPKKKGKWCLGKLHRSRVICDPYGGLMSSVTDIVEDPLADLF